MLKRYADLKVFLRIHNRHSLSGRCTTPDTSIGSLSLRERAGVRGMASKRSTDLYLLRIHNRLFFSGRCTTPDTSVSSLSLRERAGVRGAVSKRSTDLNAPY
jgi:hypothetical protein